MNLKEFMDFVRDFDSDCNEILGIANKEYAAEEDKFFNFRTVASLLGEAPHLKDITPHDIASIYFLKHVFSIVRGFSQREDMMGRYHDAANYIKLMAGMYQESRVDKGWDRLKDFSAPRNVEMPQTFPKQRQDANGQRKPAACL